MAEKEERGVRVGVFVTLGVWREVKLMRGVRVESPELEPSPPNTPPD